MIEQLKELLKQKKSHTFYAEKLGISATEVKELLAELRSSNYLVTRTDGTTDTTYTFEQEVNQDTKTIKSTVELDFEPKDDIELAKAHRVNLDKYKISSYRSSLKANGHFLSSIYAVAKKATDYTPEDFAKFLENYKPVVPSIGVWYNTGFKEIVDAEVSISDFHLAKKTLNEETLEDRKMQFLNAVMGLSDKITKNYTIDKLVFPISNDFFHTDNYQNQTTAGTPQDTLVSYDKEYEAGFDLLVTAIYYLKSISRKLEVILVQGNHDRTKSFYLAHALEVYFKQHADISFQREHSTTKSVTLGCTFIGYHHGNCKIDDLPLLFATGKDSQSFGNALYREVHTGDKHHYMAKEIKGVRIQQSPSLSGTDRWHEDNLFVNSIRAGVAYVYDKETGRCGEWEHRIKVI